MRRVHIAGVLLMLMVIGGCASESETSTRSTAPAVASTYAATTTTAEPVMDQTVDEPLSAECDPTPPVAVRPLALARMLAYVPNDDAYRASLRFNNVALFNQETGIDLPGADCDEDIQAYGEATFDGMRFFPAGLTLGTPSEVVQSETQAWGFSFLDHLAEVHTGAPSNPLRIRLLDIDPQQIADAVASDEDWSGEVTELGDLFFDWGSTIDFDRETPARPLGRGGALAVGDGLVVQAEDADVVAESLAASELGAGLDSDPHYNALATELDTRGVHAAYLTDEIAVQTSFELGAGADLQSIRQQLAAFPRMPRPQAIGLGWTHGDPVGRFTIVLAATSGSEAQAMVDAVLARLDVEIPEINYSWADRLDVIEAVATGHLAVVVAHADQPIWLDRLETDLLLAPTS